jgi:hypothetical protein
MTRPGGTVFSRLVSAIGGQSHEPIRKATTIAERRPGRIERTLERPPAHLPMPSLRDLMPHLSKVEVRPAKASFAQLGVVASMGIVSELANLTKGQVGALLSARSYARDVLRLSGLDLKDFSGQAFVEASLIAFIVADPSLLERATQVDEQQRALTEDQRRDAPLPLVKDSAYHLVAAEAKRLLRLIRAEAKPQ